MNEKKIVRTPPLEKPVFWTPKFAKKKSCKINYCIFLFDLLTVAMCSFMFL
jgi:hypothetical protein